MLLSPPSFDPRAIFNIQIIPKITWQQVKITSIRLLDFETREQSIRKRMNMNISEF